MNQDNSAIESAQQEFGLLKETIESSQQEFGLLKEKVLKLMERHDAILDLFHKYRFELIETPTGREILKKYVKIMRS